MNTRITRALCAMAIMTTAIMNAQTTRTQTGETRTVKAPCLVTIEGCLHPEEKIPGREPSALERAGLLEDYILTTNTKVVKGLAPRPATVAQMNKCSTRSSASATRN